MSENNDGSSRHSISHVVVDVIKTVLYIRGQFPVPLEQLKAIATRYQKESSGVKQYGKVQIFVDPENHGSFTGPKTPLSILPRKHSLADSLLKIDENFESLVLLIKDNKVLELVLSLGNSFMIPSEIYHIKLPRKCEEEVCKSNIASVERCKRQVLRDLFENQLINKQMPQEKLMPIYIMLLLAPGTKLTGNMECKMCYKIPKSSKQIVLHLSSVCDHTTSQDDADSPAECEATNNIPNIWVKLKPDIKGLPINALNV